MSHPAASPQQKHMDALRNRVSLASPDWGVTSDGDKLCLTAAGKDGSTAVATIAADAPFGDAEMVLNAPADLIWLLGIYDTLAARYRARHAQERQQQPPPKDYAAECAIKCAEPAFKKFLEECHGLERPLTDDRTATRIRSILKITSRSELGTDKAAAARWQELRKHFEAWRKR